VRGSLHPIKAAVSRPRTMDALPGDKRAFWLPGSTVVESGGRMKLPPKNLKRVRLDVVDRCGWRCGWLLVMNAAVLDPHPNPLPRRLLRSSRNGTAGGEGVVVVTLCNFGRSHFVQLRMVHLRSIHREMIRRRTLRAGVIPWQLFHRPSFRTGIV
jgi:hypothetical protein